MRRLLLVPASFVCACTITVTPFSKKSSKPRHRSHRPAQHTQKTELHATPTPHPSISEKVHEIYKPLYEKLPP